MHNSISTHIKKLASLWVLNELTGAEKMKFEQTLSKSQELQTYVKELQSSIELFSFSDGKKPSESFLKGQRNLLRGRIDSLESESLSIRLIRKVSSKREVLKSILIMPRPVLAVISYIFIGIVVGRYLLTPQISQETPSPTKISEISIEQRIQSIIKNGQLTATDIRYKKNGSNKIAFQLKAEDEFSYTGGTDDALVKELLFYLLLNDGNPGKRLRSIKLMSEYSADDEAKTVLVAALLSDNNPGIRLRAIRSLSEYGNDKQVVDACIKTLLEDENTAVRMGALEILSRNPQERIYPVLQVVARLDNNEFIRNEAAKILGQLEDIIELTPIGDDN